MPARPVCSTDMEAETRSGVTLDFFASTKAT